MIGMSSAYVLAYFSHYSNVSSQEPILTKVVIGNTHGKLSAEASTVLIKTAHSDDRLDVVA